MDLSSQMWMKNKKTPFRIVCVLPGKIGRRDFYDSHFYDLTFLLHLEGKNSYRRS